MWIRNTGRKIGEYAERNFHLQQCLMKLRGQYFKKIKWGIINCPNEIIIFFFIIFNLKVVTNEKQGVLGRWQMIGIGLGQW